MIASFFGSRLCPLRGWQLLLLAIAAAWGGAHLSGALRQQGLGTTGPTSPLDALGGVVGEGGLAAFLGTPEGPDPSWLIPMLAALAGLGVLAWLVTQLTGSPAPAPVEVPAAPVEVPRGRLVAVIGGTGGVGMFKRWLEWAIRLKTWEAGLIVVFELDRNEQDDFVAFARTQLPGVPVVALEPGLAADLSAGGLQDPDLPEKERGELVWPAHEALLRRAREEIRCKRIRVAGIQLFTAPGGSAWAFAFELATAIADDHEAPIKVQTIIPAQGPQREDWERAVDTFLGDQRVLEVRVTDNAVDYQQNDDAQAVVDNVIHSPRLDRRLTRGFNVWPTITKKGTHKLTTVRRAMEQVCVDGGRANREDLLLAIHRRLKKVIEGDSSASALGEEVAARSDSPGVITVVFPGDATDREVVERDMSAFLVHYRPVPGEAPFRARYPDHRVFFLNYETAPDAHGHLPAFVVLAESISRRELERAVARPQFSANGHDPSQPVGPVSPLSHEPADDGGGLLQPDQVDADEGARWISFMTRCSS